jgi:2-C-methyl-D-erythritol 4-phosphate cytidylyltransferase
MNYGVILAGGTGERMTGFGFPKQFITLEGTPIIILTLNRMLEVEQFDKVYVVIHPYWKEQLESLIGRYCSSQSNRIVIGEGGSNRIESIQSALDLIEVTYGVNSDDVVVIHDAVRPFVTCRVLENSIDAARKYGAVVAATPATDTMLWIEEDDKVASMPNRSKLQHGQSPDSFRMSVIYQSLKTLTPEQRMQVTGTAQICMLVGYEVHTIQGDRANIKITTPEDLIIAEGLLKEEIASYNALHKRSM